MRSPWAWLGLGMALVALDQLVKYVAVHALEPGSPVALLPFLSLVLTYNPGAAFSFLAGAGGWQRWFFVAVALLAAVILTVLIFRHRRDGLLCAALMLVLGGAVGNLIDRLIFGAVVDFVLLHWRGWSWPAFNLADSCITVGAVLLVWDSLRGSRLKTRENS
ncbi:MAG: signal peptidase II [Burkholderiales bacterium]